MTNVAESSDMTARRIWAILHHTKPSVTFCMENGRHRAFAMHVNAIIVVYHYLKWSFHNLSHIWMLIVFFGFFWDDPIFFGCDKHEEKQCEKQDFVNTRMAFWNWYAKQITSLSSNERQETQSSQFVICQMRNVLSLCDLNLTLQQLQRGQWIGQMGVESQNTLNSFTQFYGFWIYVSHYTEMAQHQFTQLNHHLSSK